MQVHPRNVVRIRDRDNCESSLPGTEDSGGGIGVVTLDLPLRKPKSVLEEAVEEVVWFVEVDRHCDVVVGCRVSQAGDSRFIPPVRILEHSNDVNIEHSTKSIQRGRTFSKIRDRESGIETRVGIAYFGDQRAAPKEAAFLVLAASDFSFTDPSIKAATVKVKNNLHGIAASPSAPTRGGRRGRRSGTAMSYP